MVNELKIISSLEVVGHQFGMTWLLGLETDFVDRVLFLSVEILRRGKREYIVRSADYNMLSWVATGMDMEEYMTTQLYGLYIAMNRALIDDNYREILGMKEIADG